MRGTHRPSTSRLDTYLQLISNATLVLVQHILVTALFGVAYVGPRQGALTENALHGALGGTAHCGSGPRLLCSALDVSGSLSCRRPGSGRPYVLIIIPNRALHCLEICKILAGRCDCSR